jgi:ribonuclease HII
MYIGGLDECGKGAAFHILMVSICVIDKSKEGKLIDLGVTDSKKLSHKKREMIYKNILPVIDDYSLGWSTAREIDSLGINKAHSLACNRAYKHLDLSIDLLYVDGPYEVELDVNQEAITKGDLKIPIVGAASIIGKVIRDRWISLVAKGYPDEYDLYNNKGYLTKKHREAITKLGMGYHHRYSYCKNYLCNDYFHK